MDTSLLICVHAYMSHSLQPHGLQHTRLPCPSLSLRVCWNSCILIRWCHPMISSSVSPFSSFPQSYPASVSFPVSQFFPSGGLSIGASASASVLPMNIQGWFPLGLMCMIIMCMLMALKLHFQYGILQEIVGQFSTGFHWLFSRYPQIMHKIELLTFSSLLTLFSSYSLKTLGLFFTIIFFLHPTFNLSDNIGDSTLKVYLK